MPGDHADEEAAMKKKGPRGIPDFSRAAKPKKGGAKPDVPHETKPAAPPAPPTVRPAAPTSKLGRRGG
jgi:hypothetical protein